MPRNPFSPRPGGIPGPRYASLCRMLRERTGIVLEPGKEYFVEMRLSALADQHGFGTVTRLLESLETEESWGVLHRCVAESLAVTETTFFRDLHPFDELKNVVLPQLIERRREERTLNLWCASVASGQEPYSLAMLLKEHFPELALWRVRLVATDFSTAMLHRCREGLYSQIEVNRGLPATYLVKYFTREGPSWRLREDLRRQVEFRELNLVKPWPLLPPMDVVLMRNVLIYFSPETRRHVLSSVRQVIREDGCLILGSSETSASLDHPFEPRSVGRTVLHYPRGARAA